MGTCGVDFAQIGALFLQIDFPFAAKSIIINPTEQAEGAARRYGVLRARRSAARKTRGAVRIQHREDPI